MIEYDADLVSDSTLTHSVVRNRLARREGRRRRGEDGKGMRERDEGGRRGRFRHSGAHPAEVLSCCLCGICD